jgi:hypothetical protein
MTNNIKVYMEEEHGFDYYLKALLKFVANEEGVSST